MEYHALTGEPVEEPICGLPSVGYNEGRRQA
jgi:hypothetical protein